MAEQKYALIRVHTEWDNVYRVPVDSEEAAWELEPNFSEDQLLHDEGGNTEITSVEMED